MFSPLSLRKELIFMEKMENKIETHEEMINVVARKHFGEKPKSVVRITTGICNEVYNTKLSNREIIARLSPVDRFLKGSHYHIPILKKLGISVPDILAEDYSKKDIPYAYQFLSKLDGVDIGMIIEKLSDEQLKAIAKEISKIIDKVRTIPSNGKFGDIYGDYFELSDSWVEKIRNTVRVAIQRNEKSKVLDEKLLQFLNELIENNLTYLNQVESVSYLDDICSKNVMIDNGKFSGLVDLDCLAQGDPLEAIGRMKASWAGTHYGEVYTNAVMDNQSLDTQQRKIVLFYALLNRIAWSCENGVNFNQNTSSIVDKEKVLGHSRAIDELLKEYKELQ